VAAAQQEVMGELPIDPQRVSIAGHSAGGAYAYLLAYGTARHYSAVFTLSAPFYSVAAVTDPQYTAPIRMYYGTTDPNYTGGAEAQLVQQWHTLGVPEEEDIQAGYGHNFWPPDSMAHGFLFAVSKSYKASPPPSCVADATHLCLLAQRYRVGVSWQTSNAVGVGTVTGAAADASGVFWFFAPDNWELLVKMVDGCALNQHLWVFAAGTTNVQFTLTVTDTKTGAVRSYENGAGHTATPIADTSALATCP
jgi:hypothetical protein